MLTIKSFDLLRTKSHFDYCLGTGVNIYKAQISLRAKYAIIPSHFITAVNSSTVFTSYFDH